MFYLRAVKSFCSFTASLCLCISALEHSFFFPQSLQTLENSIKVYDVALMNNKMSEDSICPVKLSLRYISFAQLSPVHNSLSTTGTDHEVHMG